MKSHDSDSKRLWAKIIDAIVEKEDVLPYTCMLVLLAIGIFSITLAFVPSNGDDLTLLSSVAKTSNPLSYFVEAWGQGNNAYRPLHSISVWLVYRAFGVSAFPNELINLVFHVINVLLLFKLLARIQQDKVIAFLFAALTLFSVLTISPASWVSDRPTLLVATALLLLLNHLLVQSQTPQRVNLVYVSALSVLALLSKESGLILPLILIFASFRFDLSGAQRIKMTLIPVLIIVCYFLARAAMFGQNVVAYNESGYLFGVTRYESLAALPPHMQYLAHTENVVKNFLTPMFPIFGFEGQIDIGSFPWSFMQNIPVLVLSVALVVITIERKLSEPQRFAIVIMVLNALLHYAVFRYRVQYLAQVAFCIFLASSPLVSAASRYRKTAIKLVAFACLCFSTLFVERSLHGMLLHRYEELNTYHLVNALRGYSGRVDQKIIQQVIDRYERPMEQPQQ